MGLGIELTFVPTLEPDLPFAIPTDPYGLTSFALRRARRPCHDFHDEPPARDADHLQAHCAICPCGWRRRQLKGSYEVTVFVSESASVFGELDALGLIAPFPRTHAADRSLFGRDGAHARRRRQRARRRASVRRRRSAIPAAAWRNGSEHRPIRRRCQLPLLTHVGLRPTPRLGRLRGPLRPAPLPRGRAVRAAVMRQRVQNSRQEPHNGLST